jgi:hypothetical protein
MIGPVIKVWTWAAVVVKLKAHYWNKTHKITGTARASGSHLVTLATQEAKIRRIAVRSQPWANSSQDSISK